jgi:2-oxoglutarate dehydrogenase E1 component
MTTSFLARWSEELLDENYEKWIQDRHSVGPDWASFFEGFELGFARYSKKSQHALHDVTATTTSAAVTPSALEASLQARVERLLQAYRTLGHRAAHLDPLASEPPKEPFLELSALGFSQEELGLIVSTPSFRSGTKLSLETLIQELCSIYTGTATVEYMHIQDPIVRDWVQEQVEQTPQAADETSHYRILRTLHKAELFENFLHTTYVGSKRFSIEGGESLMVALSEMRRRCAQHQIKEIVLGMAHRGRLNVLANFLKKPFAVIFNEFSEQYAPDIGEASGDV